MHSKQSSRRIIYLVLTIMLISTLACRATGRISQRLDQKSGTNNSESAPSGLEVEGETAVPAPNQTADTEALGDEFENLLEGLIHENDQADDLEDFPDYEN